MITPFSFFSASGILFGRGQAAQAADWLVARAQQVLLVQGANTHRASWLAEALQYRGVNVTAYRIVREPDLTLINQGVALARRQGVQAVVSVGGGSVIDAGKAIAALVKVPGDTLDYLEVVGNGRKLEADPLPFVALPTTAGTGAEVTKNAVIGVPQHQRKVSLRDDRMLADLAIVDPALMDHTPGKTTLFSGLDALTQLIEPYICLRANPFTDALCCNTIPSAIAALQQLMTEECADSRDQLAWASLCSGLALANAGLGVVHGLAGPLGGLCDAPHGAICGVLLPYGLELNRRYVTDSGSAQRIDQTLDWLAQAFQVTADNACDALRHWSRQCGLPSLQQLGVSASALETAARAAVNSSSMRANPVTFTVEPLVTMLQHAWQAD